MPDSRRAVNELAGPKRPSSVLVRGSSALEIAKQIGVVPAHWGEEDFILWLRQPATQAAQAANALLSGLQGQINIRLSNADQAMLAKQAQLDAQYHEHYLKTHGLLNGMYDQLNEHYDQTRQYLRDINILLGAAREGELTMAELQVITDMLALRNFGSQEVIATGDEQFIPLPITGLTRRNVHLHWGGMIQPHENHEIVDNAVYFTVPAGQRVIVTIS
jgi:hypothetical protein